MAEGADPAVTGGEGVSTGGDRSEGLSALQEVTEGDGPVPGWFWGLAVLLVAWAAGYVALAQGP